MATAAANVDLPNVGPGPDPCSLSVLAVHHDFLVVLLQRSPHCRNCKKQVRTFADWHDEFRDRGAEVVSVLPGDREAAADWQREFDLPFPLLADPEAEVGERFDQSVRFGLVGRLSDLLGRMPKAVVLDCRAGVPEVVWTHEGSSTFDRPGIVALLDELDRLRET